jgi:hypothetical protein
MDIKVMDLEYKERDFEYAKSKYGVAFRRAEVAPGEKVWSCGRNRAPPPLLRRC